MEIDTMGKVLVTAKIDNLGDLFGVDQGTRVPDQVRSVEVTDALVDTGATKLALPKRLVEKLGLKFHRTRPTRTAGGPVTANVYSAVRLTIQGRDCVCDVMEIPDDCPVLIGQVPLELLDWVVDPSGQRLIGNPAHGGDHILEAY